jgi:hypothetical protein
MVVLVSLCSGCGGRRTSGVVRKWFVFESVVVVERVMCVQRSMFNVVLMFTHSHLHVQLTSFFCFLRMRPICELSSGIYVPYLFMLGRCWGGVRGACGVC